MDIERTETSKLINKIYTNKLTFLTPCKGRQPGEGFAGLGKVSGRRGQDQPKSRLTALITLKSGLTTEEAVQAAQDQTRWKRKVRSATAARPD